MHGAEARGSAGRKKVNECSLSEVFKNLVQVSRMDRVRNEEVRRGTAIKSELTSRVDPGVFTWFGHVERMNEYRMSRMVLMTEISGGRVRCRPRFGWMDDLGQQRDDCRMRER